jgi:hypothetical protein
VRQVDLSGLLLDGDVVGERDVLDRHVVVRPATKRLKRSNLD